MVWYNDRLVKKSAKKMFKEAIKKAVSDHKAIEKRDTTIREVVSAFLSDISESLKEGFVVDVTAAYKKRVSIAKSSPVYDDKLPGYLFLFDYSLDRKGASFYLPNGETRMADTLTSVMRVLTNVIEQDGLLLNYIDGRKVGAE